MLGPRRFSQLRADLAGVSASTPTQRLSDLERRQVLRKTKPPPPAATPVYELTEWGYEAEPITSAMGRWAARSPSHDPSRRISGVSLLLSFRTMLDVDRCRDLDARLGFRLARTSMAPVGGATAFLSPRAIRPTRASASPERQRPSAPRSTARHPWLGWRPRGRLRFPAIAGSRSAL